MTRFTGHHGRCAGSGGSEAPGGCGPQRGFGRPQAGPGEAGPARFKFGPARPSRPARPRARTLVAGASRQRPRRDPLGARRGADARVPDHAAARRAQRRHVAPEPGLGVSRPCSSSRTRASSRPRRSKGAACSRSPKAGKAEAEASKERPRYALGGRRARRRGIAFQASQGRLPDRRGDQAGRHDRLVGAGREDARDPRRRAPAHLRAARTRRLT